MAIDNLKDIWKNQTASKIQFSEIDIYKMIHKKSASIVKWIFYISIIEFVVFILPAIFIETSEEEKELGLITLTKTLNIISYGIIMPVFIYLFYKNYKSISVQDTSKKLMAAILKTRKIVSYYVLSQLIIVAILLIVFFYKLINSRFILDTIPEDTSILVIWGISSLVILFFLTVVWLFYKLIYGILLKELKNNYQELLKKEHFA